MRAIDESTKTISCVDLANVLGIDAAKVRRLCKLENELLRPPGFYSGRQYRIWAARLDDYLYSEGKYANGGLSRAMELIN